MGCQWEGGIVLAACRVWCLPCSVWNVHCAEYDSHKAAAGNSSGHTLTVARPQSAKASKHPCSTTGLTAFMNTGLFLVCMLLTGEYPCVLQDPAVRNQFVWLQSQALPAGLTPHSVECELGAVVFCFLFRVWAAYMKYERAVYMVRGSLAQAVYIDNTV